MTHIRYQDLLWNLIPLPFTCCWKARDRHKQEPGANNHFSPTNFSTIYDSRDNGKEVLVQIVDAQDSKPADETPISEETETAQSVGKLSRSSTSTALGDGGRKAGSKLQFKENITFLMCSGKSSRTEAGWLASGRQAVGALRTWECPPYLLSLRLPFPTAPQIWGPWKHFWPPQEILGEA